LPTERELFWLSIGHNLSSVYARPVVRPTAYAGLTTTMSMAGAPALSGGA
jgi:hypothetical protein